MSFQFPTREFATSFAWYEAQQGKFVKQWRENGQWFVFVK